MHKVKCRAAQADLEKTVSHQGSTFRVDIMFHFVGQPKNSFDLANDNFIASDLKSGSWLEKKKKDWFSVIQPVFCFQANVPINETWGEKWEFNRINDLK